MRNPTTAILLTALLCASYIGSCAEVHHDLPASIMLDALDSVGKWRPLGGRPTPELHSVENGNAGAAEPKASVRVRFPQSDRPQFIGRGIEADERWDRATGLSFRVKRTSQAAAASDLLHDRLAVTLLDESMTHRYVAVVALIEDGWQEIRLPWSAFLPETASEVPFNSGEQSFKPSQVRALWLGRWFYLAPWTALEFHWQSLKLFNEAPSSEQLNTLAPGMTRTLKKLNAKQPVRILCIGDSITYGTGLSDPAKESFPPLLEAALRQKFQYEKIDVRNVGIPGLETTQASILVPQWLLNRSYDLAIVHLGFNDNATLHARRTIDTERARSIRTNYEVLLERIALASYGRTEVLMLPPIPGAHDSLTLDTFAQQSQSVAEQFKAAISLAPRIAFLRLMKQGNIQAYFCRLPGNHPDYAHPNTQGQRLFLDALLQSFDPQQ